MTKKIEEGISIESLAGEERNSKVVTRAIAKAREDKKLTAKEKLLRDEALVRDRLRRMSWADLGEKYGVTARAAQYVWAKWREANDPAAEIRGRDPVEIVYDMLGAYEAWIEQLAEVASREDGMAKISAINAQMSAQDKAVQLCQATGILPRDLGTLRIEVDVRVLAQRVLAVLNDHGVGSEVRDALLEALEHR